MSCFPLQPTIFIFFQFLKQLLWEKIILNVSFAVLGCGRNWCQRYPHLEIEVAKHSTALVFSVANVKYKRESIFGDKVDYFDKKIGANTGC